MDPPCPSYIREGRAGRPSAMMREESAHEKPFVCRAFAAVPAALRLRGGKGSLRGPAGERLRLAGGNRFGDCRRAGGGCVAVPLLAGLYLRPASGPVRRRRAGTGLGRAPGGRHPGGLRQGSGPGGRRPLRRCGELGGAVRRSPGGGGQRGPGGGLDRENGLLWRRGAVSCRPGEPGPEPGPG